MANLITLIFITWCASYACYVILQLVLSIAAGVLPLLLLGCLGAALALVFRGTSPAPPPPVTKPR